MVSHCVYHHPHRKKINTINVIDLNVLALLSSYNKGSFCLVKADVVTQEMIHLIHFLMEHRQE